MTEHKISWLNMPGYQPETWNPIVGCSKVSPGCDNCYALKMAKRIAGMERTTGRINYRATLIPDENNIQNEWNGHTFLVKNALSKPASWKSPRMIFVNSMGDLFHEGHLFEWIDAVFSVISDNDQHLYILLTKRPESMLKFWQWKREQHGINWVPKSNVWLGVTAENQEQANKRIPILLSIPAAKRIVSIEPMLGKVDLKHGFDYGAEIAIDFLTGDYYTSPRQEEPAHDDNKLDWVICGGESGPKARPMHPDWVRSVRDQCASANVPFFFKQWGEWKPYEEGDQCKTLFSWANDSERNIKIVSRVGRKAAGNLLDGEQHHNWPIDQEKCKIGSEACVYHACMDDGCQKQHMLKVKSYGLGDCEKPKTNIQ